MAAVSRLGGSLRMPCRRCGQGHLKLPGWHRDRLQPVNCRDSVIAKYASASYLLL